MLRQLYFVWCVFWLVIIFVLIFPFFVVFIQRKSWHKYSHYLYQIWAWIFFPIIGVRVHCEQLFDWDSSKQYIFCPNHTSFIDIALMVMCVPSFAVFVGTAGLAKIPLFGYHFVKLHIPVNRRHAGSRAQTYTHICRKIDEGHNLIIFPEGGIRTQNPPDLVSFKNGAFKAAIEKQIDIVPVSILNSWKLLPDKKPFYFYRHDCRLIFHKAISTKGKSLKDMEAISQQTYEAIKSRLPHSDTKKP
ncbi:MAG: 1-acyl-sn-glycerol-3-phosphate acyltransferase [Bernardetiaceae bacterium]|nr:1-acyl-sn-glycerol-3-phosphate acyltransferase [Bernardetiaceae bacterium]